jgi:hypothetical protein
LIRMNIRPIVDHKLAMQAICIGQTAQPEKKNGEDQKFFTLTHHRMVYFNSEQ